MARMSRLTALFSLAICVLTVSTAGGIDYVILKDGTVLQGRYFKEKATIRDPKGAGIFTVDKANGLEGIDTGAKTICFGSIGAQIGESGNDGPKQEFVRYERRIPAGGYVPLPGGLQLSALDFDAEWKTKFRIKLGNGQWDEIKLHLTSLDPTTAFILSSSHRWRLCFDTRELGPAYTRKLLVTHPDLIDQKNPLVRIAIARFFREAGWLDDAQAELDRAHKEIPGDWPAKALEQADQLKALLDRSIAVKLANDAEKAVLAGRYLAAASLIAKFKPETADAKDVTRITNLKATLDSLTPRFERTRSRLLAVLDRLDGGPSPLAAITGGVASSLIPREAIGEPERTMIEAGRTVLADLHPDTAIRLDLFDNLASQAAALSKAGQPVEITDTSLIALAVTGFLKGKNGATADVTAAVRCWNARRMIFDYLTAPYANDRVRLVEQYQKSGLVAPFDEIAQIISLLTPTHPVDVSKPGEPIAQAPGIFQQNTGQLPDRAAGVDYTLRLPTEYHHGRAYPVVIVLGVSSQAPVETVARLASEADRNGFILAAPVWNHVLGKQGYDFSGDGHSVVTATLKDLVRKVNVDTDRVMLFGVADGGTLALDVACGHPDHFAGLATFGSYPKSDIFMDYWTNLQKVPQYAVSGELAGDPLKLTYTMFTKLLKAGFPSLFVVYKGRAVEFFSAEVEPMFDWFHRRIRPPTASIVKPTPGQAAVSTGARFDWVTMRKSDNRFYWVQCDQIANNFLMKPPKGSFPASINPDIRTDRNQVVIKTRGIKQFTIYFERDMIDWTKPLHLSVNDNTPPGYKSKILQPDLAVMLEEFRLSGDRKRLFLQKLTLTGF